MKEELLSEWPIAQNWGFVLFLFCFFISMQLLGKRSRLFSSMLHGLFREGNRQSIFFEPVDNEVLTKLLLCLQTVILSAVCVYCVFIHDTAAIEFETMAQQLFWTLGTVSLVIIVFILYKFASIVLIGNIFFPKENVILLNYNLFSIISLSGFILFIPALLMFYVNSAYYFCLYFNLIYFLFVEILIIYKIYVIFLHSKRFLLYFILYLCAQEIVPLYLVYRALIYLLMQKGSLWFQI
jgi:hypothetical protein